MNDKANLIGSFALIAIIGCIIYLLERPTVVAASNSGAVDNSTQGTTAPQTSYNLPNYIGYNSVPFGEIPAGFYTSEPMPKLGIVPGTPMQGGSGCGCGGSAAPAAQAPVL